LFPRQVQWLPDPWAQYEREVDPECISLHYTEDQLRGFASSGDVLAKYSLAFQLMTEGCQNYREAGLLLKTVIKSREPAFLRARYSGQRAALPEASYIAGLAAYKCTGSVPAALVHLRRASADGFEKADDISSSLMSPY